MSETKKKGHMRLTPGRRGQARGWPRQRSGLERKLRQARKITFVMVNSLFVRKIIFKY